MLKRSFVGLGVLVLGGCLDMFGADSTGDDDSDGGESGDTSGPLRGGSGGKSRGGTGGMPSGGTSAGDSAGGAVTGGANSGGSAGNPNTGGDAPIGGTGGMGAGGVISFAGKAGASTGGASTGGASNGGVGGAGTGNGGGAGKAGSTATGGSGGGTCTTEELLLNASFDYGDTDWQFTSYNWASLIVDQSTAGVAPESGTFLGRLGGYEVAEDILYQVVDIPPSATNIVLSFYEQLTTTWTYDYPYDLLGVGVFDAVTGDSFGEFTLSNTDAHTGWIRHQVTIAPSAAGAYVLVAGVAYGYDYDYSTLFLDTLSLQARVCR